MADYRTKGTYGLGGQVHIANKNSNVDYDYGCYDSFDDIPATLYDTVQIGKTVGIVGEDGKIKEYWWQLQDDGTYGWVEKSISRKEVEALLEDYTAKDDVKKEVVTVLTCSDTYPDVSEMDEGDMFIYTGATLGSITPGLYQIDENGDDRKIDADKDVIYKTADTSKLYVWNGEEFVEVGVEEPVVIDNTIYAPYEFVVPMAATGLAAGTYPVIILERVEVGTIITSFGDISKLNAIKWVRNKTGRGLKDCKLLVDAISTTPIDCDALKIKLTDDDIHWLDEGNATYTSGYADREIARYTLLKISNDTMFLQNREGWAELAFTPGRVPQGYTIKDIWVWHYYAYKEHKHSIDEIDGLADILGDGDEVELEFAELEDAEIVVPIESETLDAIVSGEFESDDTAMFTGVSAYTPMTTAQINDLVDLTIAAMHAAQEES